MTNKTSLAAVLAAAACGHAAAQSPAPAPPDAASSVSIYGLVDIAAYDKQLAGEGRVMSIASGLMTTSRWGLTGSEDLGGGWRSLFDLSGFIRVDTGQGGRNDTDPFFARSSWVGLSSKRYGLLKVGRIPTATFVSEINFGAFQDSTNIGPYVLQTFQNPSTQPMITGNGYMDSAWANSISYSLPTLDAVPGLSASLQGALGEGTLGRRLGGGATWRSDTAGVSATFDSLDHGQVSVGASTAATATLAKPQFRADHVRTYQAGAFYDFKVVRVFVQGSQTTFSNAVKGELRLRTGALSATVPVGFANLIAEWSHTGEDRRGVVPLKRDTEAGGVDYLLSKRTDVYAVAIHDEVTRLRSGMGGAVGMRHRF